MLTYVLGNRLSDRTVFLIVPVILSFVFLEVKSIYNQGAEDQVLLMSKLESQK